MGRFINNENSIFQKWVEKYVKQYKSEPVSLFGTLTSVSTDTTVTLSDAVEKYTFLECWFTTANPETSSTRGVVIVPVAMGNIGASYPLIINGVTGGVRVGSSGTSFRVIGTTFSTLYLKAAYGVK